MMRTARGRLGPLVGGIDEGTTSARFLVFSAQTAEVVASHQLQVGKICPQEGWVEQDPLVLLRAVEECMLRAAEQLQDLQLSLADLVAIGVTNQRETTVLWDSQSGEPLHNAVLWQDMRTTATVDALLDIVPARSKDYLKPKCGLPFSPYFSALKVRWLLDNVPEVRRAVADKRCLFGTIDSWLIWNLTGGKDGGVHVTDVTNASRTMLMDLETLSWDADLCRFFRIPQEILPQIRSSSEVYGAVAAGPLKGTPISGCLGDQQAALLGQGCTREGQAKCTYGTGCFLLYNTGTKRVQSTHGLLTTVAYQMGRGAPPVYALEGAVAMAGQVLGWLRDNLGVVKDISHTEYLAEAVSGSGDVYFVPAFSGMYAPYWQQDARGVICGITEETSNLHVLRAALEAVCFQARDVLDAMNKDCGVPLTSLQVDGGMTANNLMMQLQADLIGIPVLRPTMKEKTSLGAAIAAGRGVGVEVQGAVASSPRPLHCDTFTPSISKEERDARYTKWKMAVSRSFGWADAQAHQ